jgi:hypothetical protein
MAHVGTVREANVDDHHHQDVVWNQSTFVWQKHRRQVDIHQQWVHQHKNWQNHEEQSHHMEREEKNPNQRLGESQSDLQKLQEWFAWNRESEQRLLRQRRAQQYHRREGEWVPGA